MLKPTKARRGPVLVQSTGKAFKKNRSHNGKLEDFPNMSNAILLIFLTPFEQCLKPSVDIFCWLRMDFRAHGASSSYVVV